MDETRSRWGQTMTRERVWRSWVVGLGLGVCSGPGCFGEEPGRLVLSGTGGGTGDETEGTDLVLDCESLPLTAVGAAVSYIPVASGIREGSSYVYSSTALPAGLSLDASTGEVIGTVEAEVGAHSFEITIEEVDGADGGSATTTCDLQVSPRLRVQQPHSTLPYCLGPGDDLRDLLVDGTGDASTMRCSYSGGSGNGRLPNGMTVDEESCTVTGTIDEDRYGTWVFAMRGVQSGVEVYVPYCVTNDEPQGYQITASHGGNDDAALLPVVRTYDPTTSFSVGEDGDPRVEILAPGVCGGSCSYRYSFLRTNAPIGPSGFDLAPDGIIQNEDMTERLGFFHELRMSGPAMPAEFRDRPWVLSVAVSYCIAPTATECENPANDGAAAFELGVIMVPTPS